MDSNEEIDDGYGADTEETEGDTEIPDTPKKRVPFLTAGAMMIVAISIDIVQAVIHIVDIGVITAVISVAANFVIEAATWMLFYLWFRLIGVSFIGPRQLLTFIGMGAGEVVSAGIFPAWTVGVGLLIGLTNAESKIQKYTGVNIDLEGKIKMATGGKKVGVKLFFCV